MAVGERDPETGYLTTGHEWNGITELNTPVPRAVYLFLIATALFSLGYWVLMPAWPIGTTYTKGLLSEDQRAAVATALKEAAGDRSVWTARIEHGGFEEIRSDPALMTMVRETGHSLFGDNCAACHGRDAQGGPGFPDLADAAWLWGGDPATVAETIRVGVNSDHPDSRISQMPAFGRDGMLPRSDIEAVVAYVRSLSAPGTADPKVAAGKAVFAANCVACHGETGHGSHDTGAPDLTDRFWIYGGDARSVFATVWGGRQGRMPTWEARLSPVDRKILALYVADLRDRQP